MPSMTPSFCSCTAEKEENWPNCDFILFLRFRFSSSFFWSLEFSGAGLSFVYIDWK